MKILITGASGLIGSAIVPSLEEQGHKIGKLSRRQTSESEPYWNLEEGILRLANFTDPHVVIHLAGDNIAQGRWTADKKQQIARSRIEGTRLLVEHLVQLKNKPRLLISGSATGFYGNQGNTELNESSSSGRGFLSDVCQQWEAATEPAQKAGIRVVHLRTGMVLSSSGGALSKMLLPFKLGVGGVIGNGQQYMSWISLEDVVHIIHHIVVNESLEGPINLVSPNPVTNTQFTKTLGDLLHRPTIFPLPALIAKLVLGEMADELLLASARVIPQKLLDSGFQFQHPNLKETLNYCLKPKSA